MQLAFPRRLAVPIGVLWLVAFILGLVGLGLRLTTGHELANYTSSIPWGLWVAAYIYLVGLSAGAFLISALIYVFGFQRLEPIGKLALFTALVALVSALLTIWMDLGHMWRFYRVFTSGNPLSMMAWMVWLYTAYTIVLLAELWFAMRGDLEERAAQPTLQGRIAALLLGRVGLAFGRARLLPAPDPPYLRREADMRVVRRLGAIGVPLAIAFHGGVGALFGVVGAREYWNAPLYPLLFIVGALLSGGGLLTAVVAFLWPNRGTAEHKSLVVYLGRITLGLLAVYLIMVWAEFSITMYADIPAASRPLYQIMGGPYPWVFWVFQIALGSLLPIALMLARPRSVAAVGVGSFLIAAGFLATRLNVVIPGLVEPQLPGLDTAYMDPRLSFEYFPSLMEWLVFILVLALGTGLFYLGSRFLPLVSRPQEVAS